MLSINSKTKLSLSNRIEQNFSLIAKISTIIISSIIIFFQDFRIVIINALQNEATNYLLAIPLIFLYLLYRKRKIIIASMKFEDKSNSEKMNNLRTITGLLLTISSIFLYWGGSYTFSPIEYHLLAFPIFLTGLILILFNIKTTRQLLFPIGFLLFLIPPPATILYSVGSTLSSLSSQMSYSAITFLGVNSTLVNEIGKPITIEILKTNQSPMIFSVDVACSGIYSLIAFLVFIVLILYIIREKSWKKYTLLIVGFPLLIILNALRITLILLIGYQFGQDTALYLFHLLGGWFIVFFGTLILLAFSEKILRTDIFAAKEDVCPDCVQSKYINNFCQSCGQIAKTSSTILTKFDMVKIITIIVCAILLISIQIPVFTLTEVSAEVINFSPSGEQGNSQLLPAISGYTLNFYGRDYAFEKAAQQDASLIYYYNPLDNSKQVVWVGVEIGSAESKLHNWEYCLITYPTQQGQKVEIVQLDLEEIKVQDPVMVTRYFVYENTSDNVIRAVLYWKTETTFQTNQSTENKILKISVWTWPTSDEDITPADSLIPFAKAIANYLEAPQSLSPISLFLANNGISMSMLAFVITILSLSVYISENKKTRTMNKISYNKLSAENQQIIDLLRKVQEETTPTLKNITEMHNQRNSIQLSKEEMFELLLQLEKTGIIKKDIINLNDKPIQIWRTVLN